MSNRFKKRGYGHDSQQQTRFTLLRNTAQKQTGSNKLLKTIGIYYSQLREALPEPLTISFRKVPTLNNKLVTSHLPLHKKSPGLI